MRHTSERWAPREHTQPCTDVEVPSPGSVPESPRATPTRACRVFRGLRDPREPAAILPTPQEVNACLCLHGSLFLLHFSTVFISGRLENLIAVISILNRLIGIREGKAFFFFSFCASCRITQITTTTFLKACMDEENATHSLALMKFASIGTEHPSEPLGDFGVCGIHQHE